MLPFWSMRHHHRSASVPIQLDGDIHEKLAELTAWDHSCMDYLSEQSPVPCSRSMVFVRATPGIARSGYRVCARAAYPARGTKKRAHRKMSHHKILPYETLKIKLKIVKRPICREQRVLSLCLFTMFCLHFTAV
jgi:hypothetical protein